MNKKIFSFLFLLMMGLQAQTTGFKDLNGVMWFYNSLEDYKFNDITNQLDDLKKNGIRVLGIYSPYHGDKAKWHGCAPVDFYNVSPQNGTLADFDALVAAAHARDMKVVGYFTNIFIVANSPFFLKAAEQYKNGDRTSAEVSAFRWSDSPRAPLPTPAGVVPTGKTDGYSQWKFSPTAGAYYWSIWNEVAFDFDSQGGRNEVERAMRFWLDHELDGFMFDAGNTDARQKYFMTDLIQSYPGEKWVTFESTAAEEADVLGQFGLTSWFNLGDDDTANDYSEVVRGRYSMDRLQTALLHSHSAQQAGKMTHAWSILEGKYQNEDLMRAQEAALLAGAGMLYGAPVYSDYLGWSTAARQNWGQVMNTINSNKALLPSAVRERVPVTGKQKAYAMKSVSADKSQAVLLVFNFTAKPADIEIDLTTAGLQSQQVPVDLMTKIAMPAFTGTKYRLNLPAWGFKFLSVTQHNK